MTSPKENRFVKEVEEVVRNSPRIDIDEVREYMRIIELCDSLEPKPPKQVESPNLQPIFPKQQQGIFSNT